MKNRTILFIHQNFPGQFRAFANHLIQQLNTQVISISQPYAPALKGVQNIRYTPLRQASKQTHHYLRPSEQHVLNGQAVAKVLLTLKQQGVIPDVVIAHTGWGEALFVKDILPEVPLIGFFEFYYHTQGHDTGFDPEFPLQLDDILRIRCKRITQLLSLESVDAGISPTHWQRSTFPEPYLSKISVLHEGIQTQLAIPNPEASFTLPNGDVLHSGDEVITYVSRNLEPYRGFHVFMRCLPELLSRCPNAQVVIVGGDSVSYGRKPEHFDSWRQALLSEVSLPEGRVHFLGNIAYAQYLSLLQVSAVHLYLTVPFVLSWSLLEAMSSGCAIVASNTSPVTEVIRDQEEGLLVDFFDQNSIIEAVECLLREKKFALELGQRARCKVTANYTVEQGIESYLQLVQSLID